MAGDGNMTKRTPVSMAQFPAFLVFYIIHAKKSWLLLILAAIHAVLAYVLNMWWAEIGMLVFIALFVVAANMAFMARECLSWHKLWINALRSRDHHTVQLAVTLLGEAKSGLAKPRLMAMRNSIAPGNAQLSPLAEALDKAIAQIDAEQAEAEQ